MRAMGPDKPGRSGDQWLARTSLQAQNFSGRITSTLEKNKVRLKWGA